MFLRDRGALVELFVDGSSANRHFHNIARWYGRRYYSLVVSNPVEVDKVVAVLRKAVDELDIFSY